jgi:CRP/FNR family transcriptional regulator, cyclic AMP receptor protein
MVQPETLLKYSLFGGLLKEQVEAIIPFMQEEKYNLDEFIITEGSPNDKIFFIIEGQVSVSKKNVHLSHFSEGEAFGEMEVLDIMPAIASIKTTSQVTVMSISNKALREIYKMDVKVFALIIMNLARDVCRRLCKTDEKLTTLQPILL